MVKNKTTLHVFFFSSSRSIFKMFDIFILYCCFFLHHCFFFTLLYLLFFSNSVKLSVCFSPQTQNKEGVISQETSYYKFLIFLCGFFIILLIKLYFTYIFVYCFFFTICLTFFLPINMTLIKDIYLQL